ncbi:MAG: hypothetical protein JJE04_00845 [Acidobacteriia bacterium]|nr:hypothetical protein [Terriglobia bacterium]
MNLSRRTVFGLTLVAASACLGQRPEGGGRGPGGFGMDPKQMVERQMEQMKDRLKLTADQEKQIKPILEDSAKKMAEARGDFRPGEGPPPQEMMEKMAKSREETNAKITKVLDAGQAEEYKKMEAERRQRGPMGGRKGGGERRQRP